MKQKQISAAIVFLCILVGSNAIKIKDSSHDVSTTDANRKWDNHGKSAYDFSTYSNHMSNQKGAYSNSGFVVELDEQSNEATVKIMHVPIMRTQKSPKNMPDNSNTDLAKNAQHAQLMKEFSRHLAEKHDAANLPKIRKQRDIDFKIYDKDVIQAMIEALRKVDPSRADILQRNLFRAKVKVEIDDDDDDDYSWYRRMQYALGLSPV